jgi:uncharacterized protein YuzE
MTVRVGYDPQADALWLVLADHEVASSREAVPGLIVNLDPLGEPISVEILQVSRRIGGAAAVSLEIELHR